MQDTLMTIRKIGKVGEVQAATDASQKAIYVENERADNAYCVTLSGAYERKYFFVTEFSAIDFTRALIDGDILIVCLWSDIVVIDLPTDRLRKTINVTEYLDMFGVYKFKGGYFVHGEMTNRYFDGKFDLIWEAGGRDIFYCPKRKSSVRICEDHIDVWDFLGYRYVYDEHGEIVSFLKKRTPPVPRKK